MSPAQPLLRPGLCRPQSQFHMFSGSPGGPRVLGLFMEPAQCRIWFSLSKTCKAGSWCLGENLDCEHWHLA